ncbi:ABC transporter substrate-binding protein [Curvivirga sp.]|uniref:ABC transporter substrate-binding protein n=1 Tax=Curvivirga sp. TaxID=2856848 RepID=UPI003B5C7C90
MRKFLFILSFIFGLSQIVMAEEVRVNVALTSKQPPLVIDTREPTGLVYDVLKAMNEHQDEFHFVPRLIPAKRIFSTYQNGDIGVIAYNDLSWGWSQRGGVGSVAMTAGEDLFFSLKKEYLGTQPVKEIGAVLGFNYAFAGFDSNKTAHMDNVYLVKDEESVFRLVVNKRVQQGIVSRSFLDWMSVSNPVWYTKININPTPDHSYTRRFIVLEKSPISVDQIDSIIDDLKRQGVIQNIYANYGINFPE